jgi:Protein of unknown function (DUF1579)
MATEQPPAPQAADRTPDRAHDFDFWIGEWDVFGPQGRPVGTNCVTALFADEVDGGVDTGMLAEHWHGNGGVEGRSINAWDDARKCWHQTWMDSTGGVLLLDGGLSDGSMVLEGRAPGADPAVVERQRITWTRDGDDVRQLWQTSADHGETWTTAFDGRYRRRRSA